MAFKKRYILFGLIALEMASLPLSAKILNDFTIEPLRTVIHSTFPDRAGQTRMLVTADTPFVITAENAATDFRVHMTPSGQIGAQPFGQSAVSPGPEFVCAAPADGAPSIIYRSETGTRSGEGSVVEQAVYFSIHYPVTTQPVFDVRGARETSDIGAAQTCRKIAH